jgi:thioredoxin-dependent peroxiredoxin
MHYYLDTHVLANVFRRARALAWMALRALGWMALLAFAGLMRCGCISAERAAQMETAAAARSLLAGKPAIDFTLLDQNGKAVSLREQRGYWVVLYFYPEDGTPGCACQAEEFTLTHSKFERLSARVYGVSPDTVASHRQVSRDLKLKVTLLADPEHKVMEAYGAWVQTTFGSRVIRSTVLIDPEGRIVYHWPEVIPEGHAERVRVKLEEIRMAAAGMPLTASAKEH